MEQEILSWIESYESIIIARHKSPDLDAYGSQFGFYYALRNKYPEKKIIVVGDTNQLNYFGALDTVNEATLSKSLYFMLDTVASQMMLNDEYKYADKVVLIDHHRNEPDIPYDAYIHNVEASSTAEMITEFLKNNHIEITLDSAKALFRGIVGDTGRFLFSSTTPKTLRYAADLLDTGFDLTELFTEMYTESYEAKKVKAEFFSTVETTVNNVMYHKNDQAFLEKYQMTSQSVSRGLISQMSGMEEFPIWANFTYDTSNGKILCELRSRNIAVLDIAKNHGGGGHLFACGCTVNTWDETDKIIEELDELAKENK